MCVCVNTQRIAVIHIYLLGVHMRLLHVLLVVCMSAFVWFTPYVTVAQTPTLEWDGGCNDEGGSTCGSWTNGSISDILNLADPDCLAKVEYKIRTCTTAAGQIYTEYKIIGWELILGCEGWDSKSYYHQNYQGLKEYIILALLTKRSRSSAVPCSSTPLPQISNVYTAACGVWSCCEYEVVAPQIPVCDAYWSGPKPHYGVPPKVKACKWFACGTVCCRRRYSVCFSQTTYEGTMQETVDVKLLNKEKLGECSGQLPSPAQPCEDGC